MSRLGPRINQDTNLRLQHPSDPVEQPTVRVDLLLVLLLEHEDDLDRYQVVGIARVGLHELRLGIDRDLGRVLRIDRFASVALKPSRHR